MSATYQNFTEIITCCLFQAYSYLKYIIYINPFLINIFKFKHKDKEMRYSFIKTKSYANIFEHEYEHDNTCCSSKSLNFSDSSSENSESRVNIICECLNTFNIFEMKSRCSTPEPANNDFIIEPGSSTPCSYCGKKVILTKQRIYRCQDKYICQHCFERRKKLMINQNQFLPIKNNH